MKTSRKLRLVSLLALAIALSGCVAKTPPTPEHKVKTSACLVRSSQEVPGTPDRQIATDLVEAKVVYGLNVREVQIEKGSTMISSVLLKALQSGCVLMVSSNMDYVSALAKFAGEHPKMLVLFVGGEIAKVKQPSNFRWVADDLLGATKLAGYLAAGKSESGTVHLLVQHAYYQSKLIETAFRAGVKDLDISDGKSTQVILTNIRTAKDLSTELENLVSTDVVTLFAGRSVWRGFPETDVETPFLIGADLQPGTSTGFAPAVQVSVERKTSKYVLSAASSLLNGKVSSEPLYRKPGALKFGTNELTVLKPDSIDGALSEELADYQKVLISNSTH
jgi:hypothetical protein